MKPITVKPEDRSPSLQWYWDNRERAKQRMTERRKEYRDLIQDIKMDSGCIDCGYSDNPVALEFDHRPGTIKLFDVSTTVTRSWDDTLDEIAKCDIVCSNCHRIRTHNRRTEGMTQRQLERVDL